MTDIRLISQPIHRIFTKLVNRADEIYLAAGLMKDSGLNWLKSKANKKGRVKLNALIGIGLPSEPQAMKFMMLAAINSGGRAQIFRGNFFHPKVYLFRKRCIFTAIVGSSNLTNGGLETNEETNLLITNQNICKHLLGNYYRWIKTSIPLTNEFINEYERSYKHRRKILRKDNTIADRISRRVDKKDEIMAKKWTKLITDANDFRMKKDYAKKRIYRLNAIRKIRKSLDYPKFSKIDLDSFYKIHDLGRIVAVNKPILKRNIKRLSSTLRFLVDETVPIEQRIDSLMNGNHRQRGLGINIITKILAAVYPKKYGVQNNLSMGVLRQYGFSETRSIGLGVRYRLLCELIRKIADESGLNDLTMVDLFFSGEWYAE